MFKNHLFLTDKPCICVLNSSFPWGSECYKSNHTEVLVCVFYASKAFWTVALAFFCIPSGLSTQYLHHLLLPLFYGLFLAFFFYSPFQTEISFPPVICLKRICFPLCTVFSGEKNVLYGVIWTSEITFLFFFFFFKIFEVFRWMV